MTRCAVSARPEHHVGRRSQRGLGLLALVMVLLLCAHLAVLGGQRARLSQQAAAEAHRQAIQAREAAEAGLAWVQAALNESTPLDEHCEPAATAAATRPLLRERWLAEVLRTGPDSLRPACRLSAGRWHCHCPALGAGRPAGAGDGRLAPAFGVQLEAENSARSLWRATIDGCSHAAPDCGAPDAAEPAARHRLQVLLAPPGGAGSPPEAAVSAVGRLRLAGTALALQGDPAQAGPALQAGGDIQVEPPARSLGPPGTPDEASRRAGDPRLAEGAAALWPRLTGLPAEALASSPGWTRIACGGGSGCSTATAAALATGQRRLWIDGDLDLGGRDWGSPQQPVLLAVSGRLSASGPFTAHGLLIGGRVDVAPTGGGRSRLQGALISLGEARIDGAVDLRHDRALLERLMPLPGALLMVPGSWFDPPRR